MLPGCPSKQIRPTAEMVAGADNIDDMDLLRHRAMSALLTAGVAIVVLLRLGALMLRWVCNRLHFLTGLPLTVLFLALQAPDAALSQPGGGRGQRRRADLSAAKAAAEPTAAGVTARAILAIQRDTGGAGRRSGPLFP